MALRDAVQDVEQDDGVEPPAQRDRDARAKQIQPAQHAGDVAFQIRARGLQRSATSL
jgi:hypothetical protein